MTTIYSNKNHLLSESVPSSNSLNLLKFSDKLFVTTNIFSSQYQIKSVHVIDGSSILYQTLKDNKLYVIHQVVLWKENFNAIEIQSKISRLCQFSYVQKVFFEGFGYDCEQTNFQCLSHLIETSEQIKIKIVFSNSFHLSTEQDQPQFDLINTLNWLLSFIEQFSQFKLKHSSTFQNILVLQHQTTKQFAFYPLTFLLPHQLQKSPQSLLNLINLYLLSIVSKNLNDYLNLINKKSSYLLQVYERNLNAFELKELTDLLKDVIQNNERYTQKMLICYVEIMKQKYLKFEVQKGISKSMFQSPEKDHQLSYLTSIRQNQSNSFSNSYGTKSISLSRKIKLEKGPNLTNQNFRNSQGKKSSSITSMSPNRKSHRKYLKYTSTGLFSNTKETFQRSSSASFLLKTTQSFYQNTENFFYNKNISTNVQHFQSKKNTIKIKPEVQKIDFNSQSQIKSYLQTMGFGNKNFQKSLKADQRKILEKFNQSSKGELKSQRIFEQSSAKEISSPKKTNMIEDQGILSLDLSGDQKKMRLKQSLSIFERKKFNENFNVESEPRDQSKLQFETKKKQVEANPKTVYNSKESSQKYQNNNKQNFIKPIKLDISHQNCMDIVIKGIKRIRPLQIQRSTVMVMHVINPEKKKQPQKQKSCAFQSLHNDSIVDQYERFSINKKDRELSLKPSLANMKKQKVGQKSSQRHEQIASNDLNQQLSSRRKESQTQKISSQQSNTNSKSEKQVLSSVSEYSQIETEYLEKRPLYNSSLLQSQQISNNSNNFTLTKQFLKQIFLFINSQNKAFVDLLGSKLSYQITFYAFYINYFKLNVTKATTKQAIEKMIFQIRDYESKIMDSQKINSQQKILPQFESYVKKLININIPNFISSYWKKQDLSPESKQSVTTMSEQIDSLTVSVLKVSLRIMLNQVKSYNKKSEKQGTLIIKSLKICQIICQLIFCVSNTILSMTVLQLKKLTQTATINLFGYEKSIISKLSKSQQMIQLYNEQIKVIQQNKQLKIIDIKSEINRIQTFLNEI